MSYHLRDPNRRAGTRWVSGTWARAVALCSALAGCTGGDGIQLPSVVFATSAGVAPVFTPRGSEADRPPAPSVRPDTSQGAAGRLDVSGTYDGKATPFVTGGGTCINTIAMSGLRVRGTSVRYRSFRGTLAADNSVQMLSGNRWIIGYFEADSFHGQLNVPDPALGLACMYVVNLRRVGA